MELDWNFSSFLLQICEETSRVSLRTAPFRLASLLFRASLLASCNLVEAVITCEFPGTLLFGLRVYIATRCCLKSVVKINL